MAQGATANEQKKFKVPRTPGDIMIYPMIVGLLLNTFCPQVFEIGGFFTAACRGGSNTIVAEGSSTGTDSVAACADVVCVLPCDSSQMMASRTLPLAASSAALASV